MSKNVVTLKSWSEATQSHWILYHSIDWVWFLLVFCSNFVPERHLTCKTTEALKPRLGVTEGHQNRHGSIRRLWLSINVHSNHGFMSYHFWDEQWFQPKIANFPTPVFCAPAERVPLEWGIGAGIQKKTRMMRRTESLTISSALWQTDGQAPYDSKDRDLQPWAPAVCTFPAAPRSTQPSTLRGTVNEYQLSSWVVITSCAGGQHNMPPPRPASWQYLRIYSPGGSCYGILAI